MKNTLILIGVGVGAYGLYLNWKRNQKKNAVRSTVKLKQLSVPAAPVQLQDKALTEYEVNPKEIFAGGTYRDIPWPSDITQDYIKS